MEAEEKEKKAGTRHSGKLVLQTRKKAPERAKSRC